MRELLVHVRGTVGKTHPAWAWRRRKISLGDTSSP